MLGKNNQQQKSRRVTERQSRYKEYKSGKFWVTAGTTILFGGLLFFAGSTNLVKADTVDNVDVAQTSESVADSDGEQLQQEVALETPKAAVTTETEAADADVTNPEPAATPKTQPVEEDVTNSEPSAKAPSTAEQSNEAVKQDLGNASDAQVNEVKKLQSKHMLILARIKLLRGLTQQLQYRQTI